MTELNKTLKRLIKLKEVCTATAYPRSTLYAMIEQGLFPTQISLGARSVAWLESEVISVINARVSGASNEEVKQLVTQLLKSRKQVN